jgi:hypothetical protein
VPGWTSCVFLPLQASTEEAARDTLEEQVAGPGERHFLNVAAECAVSAEALRASLASVDAMVAVGDAATGKAAGPDAVSVPQALLRDFRQP